jgi:hypothetical protein
MMGRTITQPYTEGRVTLVAPSGLNAAEDRFALPVDESGLLSVVD